MAPGDHLGAGRRPLQEALHPLALASRVQRPQRGVRRQRVAHHQPARLLGQSAHHVVVDVAGGQHPRGGRAVLAGVVVAGARDRLERARQLDVVEHDHRRLAAQLQVHALEALGGVGGHPLAGLHRAGEGDHVHVRVLDQRGAGLGAAGDHVEDAVGQVLGRQPRQVQAGERGGGSRLEDHRVPGGQRRADLPHRHHQRVVPGRDLPHHPHRLAAHHRGVPLQVLAGGLALHGPGRAREEAQVVDHERDLVVLERLERLAGVGGLQPGDLVGVALQGVRDPQEGQRALRRGGPGPALERAPGGGDRAVDVGRRGGRGLGDGLAGGGVEHRLGAALRGIDELPVDEVLQARRENVTARTWRYTIPDFAARLSRRLLG